MTVGHKTDEQLRKARKNKSMSMRLAVSRRHRKKVPITLPSIQNPGQSCPAPKEKP